MPSTLDMSNLMQTMSARIGRIGKKGAAGAVRHWQHSPLDHQGVVAVSVPSAKVLTCHWRHWSAVRGWVAVLPY